VQTWRTVLGLSLLTMVVSGCPQHLPRPTPMAPLKDGVVMTAGVRIVAEDGSFVLEPHQRFEAPFRVKAPPVVMEDSIELGNDQKWVGCVLSRLSNTCFRSFESLETAWPAFEKAGARRVRVEVSGRGAYHGLLYLGDAPPGSSGRSGKHYKIEVPLDMLARAMVEPQVVFGGGISRNIGTVRTWILWVSVQPLTQGPFQR